MARSASKPSNSVIDASDNDTEPLVIVGSESVESDGRIDDVESEDIGDKRQDDSAAASDSGNPASGVDLNSRKSGGDSSGEPISIKRTRTRAGTTGTGNKQKVASKIHLSAAGEKLFAKQLVGAHAILALISGAPIEIIGITDEQGEEIASAVLALMAEYKIKPNPKAVAWANLIGVMGVVYAPKAIMLYALRKEQKRSSHNNVQPIRTDQQQSTQEPRSSMVFG